MSTQYGFFIDSARCTGCKTCELACKDYKNLTPEVSFRRIYEYAGAPGGVFTPTLFVGLAMGMLFACFSRLWLPGSEEMAIMMGLTGMAAFLAATTHAPIMSTLMICEMTGQYTLLPGLLITCVVSSVLSRTLRRDSIYRHHVAEHV